MSLVPVNLGSSNGYDPIADYRNRAEDFRSVSNAQNQFTQEILEQLNATVKRLEYMTTVQMPEMETRYTTQTTELKVDLQDSRDSRRRWQIDGENLESQNKKLESENKILRDRLTNMESAARFVSVLIDADADIYYFADVFISQGLEGGQTAADKLIDKIREHLISLTPSIKDARSIPIIVKAYANLRGLSHHFYERNIVTSLQELAQFWAGFSQRNPFIDFVDVGSGKEAADHKIQENLRLNIDNPQCQQIFLACAHDGGYVPVLSAYAGQASGYKDRITLITAGAGSVHPLINKLRFKSTDVLQPLFRPSESPRVDHWKELAISQSDAVVTPAVTTVAKKSDSPTPMNWVKKAQKSPTTTSAMPVISSTAETKPKAASPKPSQATTSKPATSAVPYNPREYDFNGEPLVENAGRLIPRAKDTAGNRLRDNILIVDRSADYDLIGKMRKLSLCQWHYLRSNCGNEKCIRNHDTYRRPLTPKEYDALWCLSRMGPCTKLKENRHCNDDYCIYGHGRKD